MMIAASGVIEFINVQKYLSASETKIINVQGDEPLIDPKSIDLTAKLLDTDNVDVATLCSRRFLNRERIDG